MARQRRRRNGSRWRPLIKKTMEELLQLRADLQEQVNLMAAELADLTARQAAAEPELKQIATMILKNLEAQETLRKAPGALILGGILGLGYKPAVQQQLERLRAECKTLEADLQQKSDDWGLGKIAPSHFRPRSPRGYCPSRRGRERPSMATAPSRTNPLNVEAISELWIVQRQAIEDKHGKWRLSENLASVTQELKIRARVEAEKQQEANRLAREAIVRAKVAAHDGKSRDLTGAVKKRLPTQTDCPYCGNKLGENPHADHIYPINKGGHSVPANMVFVCAACNLKKGTKTLRAFILQYDLNRDEIEKRLSELGKDF